MHGWRNGECQLLRGISCVVGVVSDCCDEERADPEGRAFGLPANFKYWLVTQRK